MIPPLFCALGAALLVSACATRANAPPSNARSPVSASHPEGVTSLVTRALDEDPPLPGEDTTGWTGLGPDASGDSDAGVMENPHAHHSPSAQGASQTPASTVSSPSAPGVSTSAAPANDHGQARDGGAHHAH